MKNEIERAHVVCALIQEEKGIKSKKFDKNKKIDFAYKYWTYGFIY